MALSDIQTPDTTDPEALRRAPQDIRANRYDVLSRLADDVAHEVKQPMNSIGINLEVLRARVRNGATDGALERAGIIEQEMWRANHLIDRLLKLFRPVKLESGPLAVDDILEQLFSIIDLQAKSARVTLEYESDSSLYALIQREPFNFAMLNLLSHAIDVEADAGGTVTLSARRAGSDIYIVVSCSHAVLDANAEALQYCATLMSDAGGSLESVEPRNDGAGSTVTLVVSPGRFAMKETTGQDFE